MREFSTVNEETSEEMTNKGHTNIATTVSASEQNHRMGSVALNTTVHIRIPHHSSVLSHPNIRDSYENDSGYKLSERTTTNGRSQAVIPLNLQLQCYHPGVLWRGLFPLISPSLPKNRDFGCCNNKKKRNEERNRKQDSFAGNTLSHIVRNDTDATKMTVPISKRTSTTDNLVERILVCLGLGYAVNREFRGHKMGSIEEAQRFQDERKETHESELGNRSLRTSKQHDKPHDKLHNARDKDEKLVDPTLGSDGDNSICFPSELFFERTIVVPLVLSYGHKHCVSHHRKYTSLKGLSTICLYILPPLMSPSDIDRTPFASIVSNLQRKVLLHKGVSAWLSTLGGGYFGIKDLAQSLMLSWQQRGLAMQVGDIYMARQCTINEAYNWMYAGRFTLAATILKNLEAEVIQNKPIPGDKCCVSRRRSNISGKTNLYTTCDEKILQQYRTAWQCLRRLKKLSKLGLEKYCKSKDSAGSSNGDDVTRTIDDYQRVRVVSFYTTPYTQIGNDPDME